MQSTAHKTVASDKASTQHLAHVLTRLRQSTKRKLKKIFRPSRKSDSKRHGIDISVNEAGEEDEMDEYTDRDVVAIAMEEACLAGLNSKLEAIMNSIDTLITEASNVSYEHNDHLVASPTTEHMSSSSLETENKDTIEADDICPDPGYKHDITKHLSFLTSIEALLEAGYWKVENVSQSDEKEAVV